MTAADHVCECGTALIRSAPHARWPKRCPECARLRKNASAVAWGREHPESRRDAKDRWKSKDPERARELERTRKAERRALEPGYRERERQWAKEWAAANPEKRAEQRRKRAYGITQQEYDLLFAGQANGCAICGKKEPNGHGWHVDHDHVSGRVRGILCHSCNVAIGLLRDDPNLVRQAADYLERSPSGDFFSSREQETG